MKNNKAIRLGLQYFAESEPQAESTTEPAENTAPENDGGDSKSTNAPESKETAEKSFTQSELNKIVSDRIKAESEKLKKKYADEVAESTRLAAMTAEEKSKHEREKREKELSERETALLRREMTTLAKEQMSAKGLPVELVSAVDVTSEDTISQSVEEISKAFTKAVSAEVSKKLSGTPPKSAPQAKTDAFLEGLGS